MPYWDGDAHGSDFAFGSIGVVVLTTVRRLEKEAELVLEKKHPEQSMLALLKILDLLIDEFPKNVDVHFSKRRYLAVRNKYTKWRKEVGKVPQKHVAEFDANAKALFESLDRKLSIESSDNEKQT